MAIRYVGPGGNNGNSGLTWALRKLTLNGVEDTPVVAGDTVYVGPGTYRETLTADVSGTSGNIITYIADATGEHTDGVGGVVRITGSNNDQTATRANCIVLDTRDYRTFRGFRIDMATGSAISMPVSEYNIIEDCTVTDIGTGIYWDVANSLSNTVRRCRIGYFTGNAISSWSGSLQTSNPGHVIENCVIGPSGSWVIGLRFTNGGGVTIRNCLLHGCYEAIKSDVTGAAVVTVNNSILTSDVIALSAVAEGDIVENYNSVSGCATARANVAVGANSVAYFPALAEQIMTGIGLPAPRLGQLSHWSSLRALAGASAPADDMAGMTRPTTTAKRSWGPVQYQPVAREATRVYGGSVASLKLADAGRQQLVVPIVATAAITVGAMVARQTNYAGTNPQLLIKQPGQATITLLDGGNTTTWNALSTTFIPATKPDYAIIELVSNNTYATAGGSIATWFDAITVG